MFVSSAKSAHLQHIKLVCLLFGIWFRSPSKNNKSQGKKFLPNFISSRHGPKKSTETRQKWKNARGLPYICFVLWRCSVVFLLLSTVLCLCTFSTVLWLCNFSTVLCLCTFSTVLCLYTFLRSIPTWNEVVQKPFPSQINSNFERVVLVKVNGCAWKATLALSLH